LLGAQAQLGGGERVVLGHRVLGAVEAVPDELAEERVADLSVDRDVAFGVVVDEVDVVAPRVAGDVGVLAELEVPFGAEDEGASVAPGAEGVGGEPVDPAVAGGAVGEHDVDVAEVLQARVVLVRVVGDAGRGDRRVVAAAVEEHLLELVAADVAEDAAVGVPVEEPVGSGASVHPVRAHPHDRDDTADGTVRYQLAGVDRALHVQPLAVVDGVLLAGRLRFGACLRQLAESGHRGLVGEVVLAVVEDPQAEVGPVDGNGGAGDELHVGVVECFLLGAGRRDARVAGAELLDLGRVGVVDRSELAAGLEQAVAHAVDVTVVEADGGEREVARLADLVGGRRGGRVAGAVAVRVAHVVISLALNSPTDVVFWWNRGAARSRPSLVRNGSSGGSGSVTVWPVIAAW
jgi:hypothetical protein